VPEKTSLPDTVIRPPVPDERIRALEAENRRLQERLQDLREEVTRNENLLHKTQ